MYYKNPETDQLVFRDELEQRIDSFTFAISCPENRENTSLVKWAHGNAEFSSI